MIILWHDVIVDFFQIVVLLLSSLITSPSFMSISLLFWSYDNICLEEIKKKSEN